MKALWAPILAILLISCSNEETVKLVVWTDRPELAFYTEFFNSGQDRYKAEVRYFENPAQHLGDSGEPPDIVIAAWLNSVSVRSFFRPLDDFFSSRGLDRSSFYSGLLALGNADNSQLLLPVSFNLPMLVFQGNASSNRFIIEPEEIRERAIAHNDIANREYTRLGFSPLSSDDFIYLTAVLHGADFRDALPIAWNQQAVESAVSWLREWYGSDSSAIRMDDDFASRYFFEPSDRMMDSGRILYSYMNSSGFFTLSEERKMILNYRWIAYNGKIPLNDDCIFYGISQSTAAEKAAETFTLWFFSGETQRQLLEFSGEKRLNELYFGIAGGFSAMRTVTEQIFPRFYPELLGHLPTEDLLSPPNILSSNWMVIRERAIVPYLRERIRQQGEGDTRPDIRPLDQRINDWNRLSRF